MSILVTRYRTISFLCLILSLNGFSQSIYEKYDIYRNPIRVFLNKISVTATTGYGITSYLHTLEGVYFYQDRTNQFIFSNKIEGLGSTFSAYSNWLNNAQPEFETSLEDLVNNLLLDEQTFLVNTDTTNFGFQGISHGIPINLMLHYEFQDFRIGWGYSHEKQFVQPLEPTIFERQVRPYQPDFKSTSITRMYGMIGYKFYDWWAYDFVAEMNIGKINSELQVDQEMTSTSLYTNFGLSIERNLSEYFRVIIRPSIDFKSYTINIPDGSSVKHRQPAFFVQFGISINFPDIPRSPMGSDHVQLKHIYTNPVTGRRMEVRGQPIWKPQNPKIGELHRKIWHHKPKNKKKINPY